MKRHMNYAIGFWKKTKHVKIEEDWYGIIYYTELLKEKLIPYIAGEAS